MDFVPPAPAASAAPADWLIGRIDLWAPDWVTGTVGPGFEAYVRVFHPVGEGAEAQRWTDVAARSGRVMHASAQWDRIRADDKEDEPQQGNLDVDVLAALCEVLARHTGTADECVFALWEGWGWQHPGAFAVATFVSGDEPPPPPEPVPAEVQLDLSAPHVELPGRGYLLFQGPVDAASRMGWWPTAQWFQPQSPSMFWPADHAWCVATEVDHDSTLVGGTRALVDALVADRRFEAWAIPPDAPRHDLVNA